MENEFGKTETMVQQYGKSVPRWSFYLATIIIGGLLSLISERLTIGPSWLILVIILVLLVAMMISVRKSQQTITRIIALIITSLATVGLISSVAFLVYGLFTQKAGSAASLLRDAAVLWVSNVSVFSVWYWEIDQGGPYLRHMNKTQPIDFLYPQMMYESELWANWKPTFMDYLFLAFNTSAAVGPTDTLVMSRRAKLLMNTQASISLVIVAVLAAHAIGAL